MCILVVAVIPCFFSPYFPHICSCGTTLSTSLTHIRSCSGHNALGAALLVNLWGQISTNGNAKLYVLCEVKLPRFSACNHSLVPSGAHKMPPRCKMCDPNVVKSQTFSNVDQLLASGSLLPFHTSSESRKMPGLSTVMFLLLLCAQPWIPVLCSSGYLHEWTALEKL